MTFLHHGLPTETLLALLRGAHDDGRQPLDVRFSSPALVVLHADGTELSETEEREVRALLAADAVEPLGTASGRALVSGGPDAQTRAAAELGRLGGSSRSSAKTEAARANGARGGRPLETTSVRTQDGSEVVVHAETMAIGHTSSGEPALIPTSKRATAWLRRHGFARARWELAPDAEPPADWDGSCWARPQS